MKIALCTDTFYPKVGGTETVVKNLADGFVAKGHEVVVFTRDYNQEYDDAKFSYKVVRTRVHKYPFYPEIPQPQKDKNFSQQLRDFNPDVVHAHTPFEIGLWAVREAKLLGVKSVLTAHTYLNYMNELNAPFSASNPIHKFIVSLATRMPKKTTSEADVLTAVSRSVAEYEIKRAYKEKRPVLVIRNGCVINESNKVYELKDSDVFKICFAGRVSAEKNLRFSLEVCSELQKGGIPFEFNIAGEGKKEEYKQIAKQLGIDNDVHFLGNLKKEELDVFYSQSDILLFPSVFDADGLVVKEANRCGCPALVIKNTGASEQINDNVNGFVLDNNIKDFYEKIVELYKMKASSYSQYIELRNRTREKKIKIWPEVAEQYLSLYSSAKEQKNG